MSFLTLKSPIQSNLVTNFYKHFSQSIISAKMQKYQHRTPRNATSDEPDKKALWVEWFEPQEQGSLIRMEGEREPMRVVMDTKEFTQAFIWKKSITLFIKFISGKDGFKKQNIISKFFILLTLLKYYPFLIRFIHHSLWDYFYDDPKKFSPAVRALYDVFPKGKERERDVACFFLDSDNAYKFRYQDILPLIDKVAFRKNPAKEINRLLDVLISREITNPKHLKWLETGERDFYGLIHRWADVKRVVPLVFLYLKIFNRKLLKQIYQMVDDIDLEKVKPSKEDRYWMDKAKSYNFRGIPYESRKLIY